MPRRGGAAERRDGEGRRRRRVPGRKAIIRVGSMAAVAGRGWARGRRGLRRMNRGMRGGQYTVTVLAAPKCPAGMPCPELRGHAREITRGGCAITAPQPHGRITALPAGVVAGGVLVGGAGVAVRRRRRGTLALTPRRGAGAGGVAVARRGGAALVGFCPGHGAGPEERIAGSTRLSGGRGSAGRIEGHGRPVGVRGSHRPAIPMGARTGARIVSPIKAGGPGGAGARRAGGAGPRRSPAAPGTRAASGRTPCDRDQEAVPRGSEAGRRSRHQVSGRSRVPGAGRPCGGGVMPVGPDSVIREIAGKPAIHSAPPWVAGAA